MPKRNAAGKDSAEEEEKLPSFPDELAINSDTSDDSDGPFDEYEEEEEDVETGLIGAARYTQFARLNLFPCTRCTAASQSYHSDVICRS